MAASSVPAPKPLSLLANQPPQRLLIRRRRIGRYVGAHGDDHGNGQGLDPASAPGITVARARKLWLWFVALLIRLGCLTHLIVLRFADAFFEHLGTLAPSFAILVFAKRLRRVASGRAWHWIPAF